MGPPMNWKIYTVILVLGIVEFTWGFAIGWHAR